MSSSGTKATAAAKLSGDRVPPSSLRSAARLPTQASPARVAQQQKNILAANSQPKQQTIGLPKKLEPAATQQVKFAPAAALPAKQQTLTQRAKIQQSQQQLTRAQSGMIRQAAPPQAKQPVVALQQKTQQARQPRIQESAIKGPQVALQKAPLTNQQRPMQIAQTTNRLRLNASGRGFDRGGVNAGLPAGLPPTRAQQGLTTLRAQDTALAARVQEATNKIFSPLNPLASLPPSVPSPGGELRKANPGDSYLPPGVTGYEPPSGLNVNADPFNAPVFTLDDIGTATAFAFGLLEGPGFVLPYFQGMFAPQPPTNAAQGMGYVSGWLLRNLTGDSQQPGNSGTTSPPPAPSSNGSGSDSPPTGDDDPVE